MSTSASSNRAFSVHFSNPGPLYKFAPDPDTHWKLLGPGLILFKQESVVLRGLRRRPDRSTVNHSAEISLVDILNVTLQGRVVRFHARIPLSVEKPLQLWAADEAEAAEIAALLSW